MSVFEPLENRRLYSTSDGGFGHPPHGRPHGGDGGGGTLEFSLTPSVVQSGLDSLASTDGLTAPTSTVPVQLGNSNGVETYSITIGSTGTVSRLTVDSTGAAVTQPAETTTTYSDLETSDAAVAAGLSAIVTANGDTALTATDTINVTTLSGGSVIYSLPPATSTTTPTPSTADATTAAGGPHGAISVDSNGIAVGNQTVTFSVLPTAIQSGLNAGAPTGATALSSSSTQDVRVQTIDGVVLYSTTFTVSGTNTTVTVNKAGVATSLPTHATADFDTLPTAAQTELQTLATAEGSTATISTTASVDVYTEATGAVLYSLQASVADSSTSSTTHDITLTVDAAGNPTVLPNDGGQGGGLGCDPGSSGGSSSSSGTTDTGLTSGLPSSGDTSTAASATLTKAAARKAKAAAAKAAKLAAAVAKKAARLAKLAAKRDSAAVGSI